MMIFALLQPTLINPDHLQGKQVFSHYQAKIQRFLEQGIQISDQVHFLESQMRTHEHALTILNRHHVIALGCFWDVLGKSVVMIDELKLGHRIDLKQAYYKPLAYFALNLRLYYQLEAKHPADIFEAIKGEYGYRSEAIVTLFIHALAFVTKQQVALHLANKYQEEEIVYTVKTKSEKSLWAGLDLIGRGIIKPLYQAFKTFLSQKTFDFKMLGWLH